MEKLLSAKQVADYLGMHVKTLQRRLRNNTIDLGYVQVTARTIGFRPAVVEKYIEAHEVRRDATGLSKREIRDREEERRERLSKKYKIMSNEEAQVFFAGCQRDPDGTILDWPED